MRRIDKALARLARGGVDQAAAARVLAQAGDLLEIVEDRYDKGSLTVTGQVPLVCR